MSSDPAPRALVRVPASFRESLKKLGDSLYPCDRQAIFSALKGLGLKDTARVLLNTPPDSSGHDWPARSFARIFLSMSEDAPEKPVDLAWDAKQAEEALDNVKASVSGQLRSAIAGQREKPGVFTDVSLAVPASACHVIANWLRTCGFYAAPSTRPGVVEVNLWDSPGKTEPESDSDPASSVEK